MPTFLTRLKSPHPGDGDPRPDGMPWGYHVIDRDGHRIVFDTPGSSVGGPGMTFAALVDEHTAEWLRRQPQTLARDVWELAKPLGVQLRERHSAEEADAARRRTREDSAFEARVRAIVRDEMVRQGRAPDDAELRPGTPQGGFSAPRLSRVPRRPAA